MFLYRLAAILLIYAFAAFAVFSGLPAVARAQAPGVVLFAGGGANGPLLQQGRPLVPASLPSEEGGDTPQRGRRASLFSGQGQGSFFAPRPSRTPSQRIGTAALAPHASQAERIRHLIARAEAGPDGYDAVQYGAWARPAQPPTRMTLSEIFAWIRDTPGQPHAIGRYQFIPATLRALVKRAGLPHGTRFSPAVQDQLADLLLEDAGLAQAQRGEISRRAFMNNLAKIWAGLPNSTGRSHYHGFAGNKATMTWARFEREMAPILPG